MVRRCWFQTVLQLVSLCQEDSLSVLASDGVKQSKEGWYIHGVKRLCQESENSAKSQFINGHMFGGLGILVGNIRGMAYIPLSIRFYDDLQDICDWESSAQSLSFQSLHFRGFGNLPAGKRSIWRLLPKRNVTTLFSRNPLPENPEGEGFQKKKRRPSERTVPVPCIAGQRQTWDIFSCIIWIC